MKKKISEIIEWLEENKLFTNAKANTKALENFKKGKPIKFIMTNGEPKDVKECRQCLKMLKAKEFAFYQARVGEDGYLNRTNALCSNCRKKLKDNRNKIFEEDSEIIPPKPKNGDICPRCKRPWSKGWHRDHDDKTHKFSSWLCGNCNMSKGDQRNSHLK